MAALFLGGARMQAVAGILVALGEIVRLDDRDVLDRRRIVVDDDVVDDLERGQVDGAQLLRHERPVLGLGDVRVGGQAGDQHVGLALGVHQVAHVPGMHDVERAVAHDDVLLARTRADGGRISCAVLILWLKGSCLRRPSCRGLR